MALKQLQSAMKILSQNFFDLQNNPSFNKLVEFANLQNANREQSSCIVTELITSETANTPKAALQRMWR